MLHGRGGPRFPLWRLCCRWVLISMHSATANIVSTLGSCRRAEAREGEGGRGGDTMRLSLQRELGTGHGRSRERTRQAGVSHPPRGVKFTKRAMQCSNGTHELPVERRGAVGPHLVRGAAAGTKKINHLVAGVQYVGHHQLVAVPRQRGRGLLPEDCLVCLQLERDNKSLGAPLGHQRVHCLRNRRQRDGEPTVGRLDLVLGHHLGGEVKVRDGGRQVDRGTWPQRCHRLRPCPQQVQVVHDSLKGHLE
mmetsp:Transcript_25405/g.66485  ORF Transcript_25405/g.66485 Transcript_25405/m.66485 type:complete len:249 (+) Transcript_25405:64-810(+)